MLRSLILAGAFALGLNPAAAQDAALVLGIGEYTNLPDVRAGDAITGSADILAQRGYEAHISTDGSRSDLRRTSRSWGEGLQPSDRVLVAVSGRMVTDGARTWLLASTATNPPAVLSVGFDSLSLDSVVQVMGRGRQGLLVVGVDPSLEQSYDGILRDGVGRLEVPEGITVVRGTPAATGELIRRIARRPGLDVIAEVRRTRALTFVGDAPRRLIMVDDADAARRAEDQAWNAARNATAPQPFLDYLERYPNGRYARVARDRLNALRNTPERRAEAAEDALGLDRDERRAVQRALTVLGYNTRGVDGIFGPGTRAAVRNWQVDEAYDATGYLTSAQLGRLEAQAARRQAEIDAEAERERQAREARDRAFWDETGARGGAGDLRLYLDRFPDGLYSDRARQELAEINGTRDAEPEPDQGNQLNEQARAQAEAGEQALRLSPVVRRLIEQKLRELGAEPGRVDGNFDADTRAAIARYQAARNLPRTGYLNQPTAASLLADTLNTLRP